MENHKPTPEPATVEVATIEQVERLLCERIPALATTGALIFPISAGVIVVAVELDGSLVAALADTAIALHRVVARVQDQVRAIVQQTLDQTCRDIPIVPTGALDAARGRTAIDPGQLPRLTDRHGLVPGVTYRFAQNVDVDRDGAMSWVETRRVKVSAGGEVVCVFEGDQVELFYAILVRRRASWGARAAQNASSVPITTSIINQLREDAASLQLLSPLELNEIIHRDDGESHALHEVYGQLARAGILVPHEQNLPPARKRSIAIVTRPHKSSSVQFIVFGAAVPMGAEESPQMAFLFESRLIDCNLVTLRDRCRASHGSYTRGVSAEINTIDKLVAYLSAYRDNPRIASTYAVGNSDGAFGAVLYGYRLCLPQIWAFGLSTYACDSVDLRTLLRVSNGITIYNLYYNESHTEDRAAAEALAGLPGVRLFPQQGHGHLVASELARQNKLATLFPIGGER